MNVQHNSLRNKCLNPNNNYIYTSYSENSSQQVTLNIQINTTVIYSNSSSPAMLPPGPAMLPSSPAMLRPSQYSHAPAMLRPSQYSQG